MENNTFIFWLHAKSIKERVLCVRLRLNPADVSDIVHNSDQKGAIHHCKYTYETVTLHVTINNVLNF